FLAMCLATYGPKDDLRRWLHDELSGWAETYEEDLRRQDVVNAIPDRVRQQVEHIHGVEKLLLKAVYAWFASDQERRTVEQLGQLYAGIATLVYWIKENEAAAFVPGRALTESETLPGREPVIRELLDLIESHSPVILRGPRRSGKTSILY